MLAQWLLTLPMAAHSEAVLRRYGLSTQTWAGWLRDRAVGLGMSAAVTVLAVVLLWWLVAPGAHGAGRGCWPASRRR